MKGESLRLQSLIFESDSSNLHSVSCVSRWISHVWAVPRFSNHFYILPVSLYAPLYISLFYDTLCRVMLRACAQLCCCFTRFSVAAAKVMSSLKTVFSLSFSICLCVSLPQGVSFFFFFFAIVFLFIFFSSYFFFSFFFIAALRRWVLSWVWDPRVNEDVVVFFVFRFWSSTWSIFASFLLF